MTSASLILKLSCQIASICGLLEVIDQSWARTLGVSEVQWRIISALADLEHGSAATDSISKTLHIKASFVTAQSKILEQKGIVRCSEPGESGEIDVRLTDKAMKEFLDLLPSRETLNDFIFAQFTHRDLEQFANMVGSLNNRLAYLRTIRG